MTGWAAHLILAPIALPLFAGVLMLLFDGRSRPVKAAINLIAVVALMAVAIALLRLADAAGSEVGSRPFVYLLGDWPAPFGIVLVLDQLSALMLLLTSILALASLVFSLARWHAVGVHFHPLFQFLLMGLNGAFLTGDLFNLFVFFEVLLAASYGLVLHGSGVARVKAGMHYIAVNLVTSSLFLIGASLIYGVTGTLNMADLALRIPEVAAGDRMLLEAAAAVLGVAFLVKAGMWPLSFWLPTAYTAATPPVAAIFAVMSKVGIYVVLRLWLLLFGPGAGESAQFGGDWLLYGGMMTIAFGMFGILAAQETGRLAGYAVLVSSGTLLAAIGFGQAGVTAGALYYLVSSTLTISAFYLLIELVERGRELGADMLAVTREAYGEGDEDETEEEAVVGFAIPGTMALLGISFLFCAVLLAGLPPLSGFIAKFAMLASLLDAAGSGPVPAIDWGYVALMILSGLAALIAMLRAGINAFWAEEREVPRVRVIEMAPIAVLLALTLVLTLQAGPAMRYMETTARALHDPVQYIDGVLAAPRIGREAREASR
jgi:multicomponent K+:H+ antiporter subunit D